MFSIRQFTFNPVQENTYVISNESGDCIVVDPGCYFGNERKELSDFIDTNKLLPKCLLNTHCHLDHVFGNKWIADTYRLSVHIHPLEQPVLDSAGDAGTSWGMPFDNYRGQVIYLKEGEEVVLGDDRLLILFTPGHSPGSVSFYCEKQKFVVSGDVLFRQGIGRTDLPGGDYETLIDSIRSQLFTLPDDTVVYSGHGPETSIGYEKLNNPFLV